MASRFRSSFASFLLCLSIFSLLLLPTQGEIQTSINKHYNGGDLRVEKIVKALSDAGYNAMSLTLEMSLPELTSSMTSSADELTIFCPSDKSFFSLRYPQPPLTLLKYQVAPMKLERDTFMSSLPLGSKIDTLLEGHPVVVTSLSRDEKPSINDVKIVHWDIYSDGDLAVHGVENFFDPAYQTLLYPRYDYDGAATLINNNKRDDDESSEEAAPAGESNWFNYVLLVTPFPLALAGFFVALLCLLYRHQNRDDYVVVLA